MKYTVTFLPAGISVSVEAGISVLEAMISAQLHPDAPCGGKGTCGKCRVTINGQEVLACQTPVHQDMTVHTDEEEEIQILTAGTGVQVTPDGIDRYVLAFDIGTTTVVAYLLDGKTGKLLSQASRMNPQSQFGADVISRIQYALKEGGEPLSGCIRETMRQLTAETAAKAGIASN